MPGLKRTVTIDTKPAKRAKTTSQLTKDVAKLRRQVNANTPEIRQRSYRIDRLPDSRSPVPLVLPTNVSGEEIKLHRILASYSQPAGTVDVDSAAWGQMYSTKDGYEPIDCLYNTDDPQSQENILTYPDQTKCRVWERSWVDSRRSTGPTPGASRNAFFSLDHKWSIPMKLGMDSEDAENPSVTKNQVYFIGAFVPEGTTEPPTIGSLYVTIWYTDA